MRQPMLRRRLRFLVTASSLALGFSSAWAQPSSMTAADLARQSDVVAVGHVASLIAQWDETHTRIRTQVTIAVSENVKGTTSGSSLTLFVPGGEVDGIGEMYSDTPVFRKDEDVIVFARKSPEGTYRVAGGTEGKYTIAKDAATGKPMVSDRVTVDEFTSQLRVAVETKALKQ